MNFINGLTTGHILYKQPKGSSTCSHLDLIQSHFTVLHLLWGYSARLYIIEISDLKLCGQWISIDNKVNKRMSSRRVVAATYKRVYIMLK